MRKLRTGGLLACVCVVGMGIVLAARSGSTEPASSTNEVAARPDSTVPSVLSAVPDNTTPQTSAVPDKIVYGIFFRQIKSFNAKADEMEKNGKDGKFLRKHFAKIAALNDTESELLDRVAADYIREESLITAQQKAVVDAYRLKYPDGHIPDSPTREPAPSFHEFTLAREQLYLRMRDQLQTVLGPQTFGRLDGILRKKIADNPESVLALPAPSATEEVKP